MRAGGALFCGWLALLAGCLESHQVVCGDGRICPAGLVCSDPNQRCVTQEQIDACSGRDELAPCEVGGGSGECHAGACLFAVCGNGVVEGNETCDGDNLGEGSDCADLGYYDRQPLRCTERCQLDEMVCTGGRCGDGAVNGPELCDGEPPPDLQCVHLGYDVGALPACTSRCAPDTSLCHRIGVDRIAVAIDQPLQALTGSGPDDVYGVARAINDGEGPLFHYDGTTWRRVLESVGSVWVVGENDVYAIAATSGLLTLQHFDGDTWSAIEGAAPTPGQQVWAGGPDDIDLLGGLGTPSMHWDGRSWRRIDGLPDGTVLDIAAEPGGTILAIFSTLGGRVLYRFEAGSWKPFDPGLDLVATVWADGPDDVWAGGRGDLAHWNGESWTVFDDPFPVTGEVTTLSGTGADDVYALVVESISLEGSFIEIGHLFEYDGSGWTGLTDLSGVHDAWAGGREAVHLAGNAGASFRYHGSLWLPEIQLPLDGGFVPASFVERGEDIFAAVNFVALQTTGHIYHWDGEQATWLAPDQISTHELNAVFGSDGGLYAAGSEGLFHLQAGDWVLEDVSTAAEEPVLTGGWSDGDAVFAVGKSLLYDLGKGDGWIETALPAVCDGEGLMHAVWGSSEVDVFAVGDCGTIVHFDGSGWSEMQTDSLASLFAVWGTGPDDVYAVGGEGTALHYDGTSWQELPRLPVATELHGVWGTNGELFAFGGQGFAFHFDGASWSVLQTEASVDALVGLSGDAHDITMMAQLGTDTTFLRLRRTVGWAAP